jgi:glycosyltransferase involved in cell wall biosynthesis
VNDVRVSVVTPVYNRPRELPRALRSLQSQTFTDFECLVVDDASDEGPEDIVGALNDDRFRVLRRTENGGCSAARTFGFRNVRGDIIATLDSDNEFYPWALERAVTLMDENPTAGCVTGLYVSPDGLRARVASGRRLVNPSEYRQSSTKGDTDRAGIVRRVVVDDWLKRRDDFRNLDFHLVFWTGLNFDQLYVDEPWGHYHTDAGNRMSTHKDPREYADPVKFVEEYRPLLGAEQCVPLDEYLNRSWFRLRRARRDAEAAIVEDWMRQRGLRRADAVRDMVAWRLRLATHPHFVKWI